MKASFSRFRKRPLRFLLPWLLLLALTGCWDKVELNDLALVTAAGIDKKKDSVELTVQVFIPKSSGGGQQGMEGGGGGGGGSSGQTLVRSGSGLTIAEAMAKLQEVLPRRVFWGHCEVYIIDEKLAREGIRKHIDFLMRHPQVREGSFIFISKDRAKNILSLIPPLERSSAEVLREMARSKNELEVTLKDLLEMLSGEAGAAAIPWIEKLPVTETGPERGGIPYIAGTAVFKRDQLIGHINDRMTRGLMWVRNEVQTAIVTIRPEEGQGYVSLSLLKAHSSLIPSIKNGKWSITLRARTDDDVVQNETNLDLSTPRFLDMIEDHLRQDLEDNVRVMLKQVQKKMKADVFGFSEAFHRKYPKEWSKAKDRWDEVFPKVEVNFEVKAYVRRPGMSSVKSVRPDQEVRRK